MWIFMFCCVVVECFFLLRSFWLLLSRFALVQRIDLTTRIFRTDRIQMRTQTKVLSHFERFVAAHTHTEQRCVVVVVENAAFTMTVIYFKSYCLSSSCVCIQFVFALSLCAYSGGRCISGLGQNEAAAASATAKSHEHDTKTLQPTPVEIDYSRFLCARSNFFGLRKKLNLMCRARSSIAKREVNAFHSIFICFIGICVF